MRDPIRISRRSALAAPSLLLPGRTLAQSPDTSITLSLKSTSGPAFRPADVGFSGVYDIDWLVTPRFSRMLDSLVASTGAVAGVRFFGLFTAGATEQFKPEGGGTVWTDPSHEPDFTIPLAALEALVSRKLIPFISLGFFPPAVSDSPISPPSSFGRWADLIQAFLERASGDPRFGAERMKDWWFEVWNEPNEGRFWSGSQDDYFALYQATAQAVEQTGLEIRLGGPAIAWKPESNPDDGPPWMERFLEFISGDRELQCDFVSYHRKGTVDSSPPDPRRLHTAAIDVRNLMDTIDPVRFAGVTIINNEADEKVGFEVPYAPRQTHVNASWLAASASIHTNLTLADSNRQYMAAADNANLQLVEAPFDGRRSLFTFAQPDMDELIRVPAFGFYEMLRMLNGEIVDSGVEVSDALYLMAAKGEESISVLVTWYPDPGAGLAGERTVDIALRDVPWGEVNCAMFLIDADQSNAWTAAGGSAANPFPKPRPDRLKGMRLAQGLTVGRPIEHGVGLSDGGWSTSLQLSPYSTWLIWLTPWMDGIPYAPAKISVSRTSGSAEIRWTPSEDPAFLTYELQVDDESGVRNRIGSTMLRAAEWFEEPMSAETRVGVRTVNASGFASQFSWSD